MVDEGLLLEYGGIKKGDRVTVNPPFEGQHIGTALGYEFNDWAIEFDQPLSTVYVYSTTAKRAGGKIGHCHWIGKRRVSVINIIGDDDDDCI